MRLVVSLMILACTTFAHAEGDSPAPAFVSPPKPSVEPAGGAMATYFKGEIRGGFVLIGMGTTELLAGTLMLVGSAGDSGNEYVRGAAFPLLGIGLAHAVAGLFVGVASAKRVRVFGNEIGRDSEGWIHREEKRMKGVSRQFLVLKIVEGVIAAGALTTAAIVRDDKPQLAGACIGLAGMMAATFVFDVVAAKRAHRYRRSLAGIAF